MEACSVMLGPESKISLQESEKRLKAIFGYEEFRPHQYESIEALSLGQSVFLRKPTGGGKSLIYQFLAVWGHRVLVLSPLVALMDDQVFQAKKYGISAFCMHSQQKKEERLRALKAWETGRAQILFVTPERFGKENFVKAIEEHKPDVFVVDEAHCASQWGHDFRPDYSKLLEIRQKLGNPTTLACTATATVQTEADVLQNLGLQAEDLKIYRDSVLRENLTNDFEEVLDFSEKEKKLKEMLLSFTGPTLVYFSLIKNLEKVAEALEVMGVPFVKYHSKIKAHDRRRNQKAFVTGEANLMLATPAFGLGVDKADIRNLLHFEIPGSVEAYVQEFGRAGRDGKPSRCVLLYSQEDLQVQMDFIKWSYPSADIIRWVHREVVKTKSLGFAVNRLDELKKKMNFYHTYDFRMESALNILLRWECLKKEEGLLREGPAPLERVPDIAHAVSENFIKFQQKKLYDLLMLTRLESQSDLKSYLQKYFGEV